jgi:hypothetical protein
MWNTLLVRFGIKSQFVTKKSCITNIHIYTHTPIDGMVHKSDANGKYGLINKLAHTNTGKLYHLRVSSIHCNVILTRFLTDHLHEHIA